MKHHISYFYNALLEQHLLHQVSSTEKTNNKLMCTINQQLLQAAWHSCGMCVVCKKIKQTSFVQLS